MFKVEVYVRGVARWSRRWDTKDEAVRYVKAYNSIPNAIGKAVHAW